MSPSLSYTKTAVPTVINELPVELPPVDSYEAKGTGLKVRLLIMKEWVNYTNGGVIGRRETDTMPGYAGSSWYFLRYMDPNNDQEFVGKESLEYWNQVDYVHRRNGTRYRSPAVQ